ncbi:MAG: hypothetical protein DPW21_08150, partial [Anaerolineae bacterium]|nr:CHAT domain-containing protein [Chloroflexi bacterium CFX1]MCQ3946655.1 hypothetical protein [Anaerolineae bacterium]
MSNAMHPTPFVIKPLADLVKQLPALRHQALKLAQLYADGSVLLTDETLQSMGAALWQALNIDAEFNAACQQANGQILPIIVESDGAEIQALPWETLYHPVYGFIGSNLAFTLTRRTIETEPTQQELDKGPLRILLFTSLPEDLDAEHERLNVEEEQAQIQEALLPWLLKGTVQLEIPNDGRLSILQELLRDFKPHVLFLSGHGRFVHQPHADEAPYGEFLFEDEAGNKHPVRDQEIAQVLFGSGVQAVILSACESSKAASVDLSGGLAQQISAQGITHVIGMRESLLDKAGILFARELCDALASGQRLDVALQRARSIMQTPDGNGHNLGQWCLPMALSPHPEAALIDWDFEAAAVEERKPSEFFNSILLPPRFIGRRMELRQYARSLQSGETRLLLITGAGGQGKTSLAGKLAHDMATRGFKVFAWNAQSVAWRDFAMEFVQALEEPRRERYERAENKTQELFDLLIEQFNDRLLFFFDNLETLQDADTLQTTDEDARLFLGYLQDEGRARCIVTSRWQIPDWKGARLPLARANYGDFLQVAVYRKVQIGREQIRRVYETLGGNLRGLEFFAAATRAMDVKDEDAFLAALQQTEFNLQANMMIAEIYRHLSADAQKLLARLPAYREPVPREGLLKLGVDLPDANALLEQIIAVSLLEASYERRWQVVEYQCSSLVTDWLQGNQKIDNNKKWLSVAADYHLDLLKTKRSALAQAITTHHALRRAERHDEANRLTLDYIVGPLTHVGYYAELLARWLPETRNSPDRKTQAEAIGQTGKLHIHIGDYETALTYLKQSLDICRQIGDKAGEGTTLNNI